MIRLFSHTIRLCTMLSLLLCVSRAAAQRTVSAAELLLQGQGIGEPYFYNYSPKDYGAHARSFDIECDTLGHTFVANFEGLLIYDNARWTIHHTPGISRVTCLYQAQDGTMWFGGFHVFGFVQPDLTPRYLVSDLDSTLVLDEVDYITEREGQICLHTTAETCFMLQDSTLVPLVNHPIEKPVYADWNGHVVKAEGKTPLLDLRVLDGIGLASFDHQHRLRAIISAESGLCSTSINDITYDGAGSIWGATDNGIFRVSVDNPFSFFHTNEGLKGEVCTILPVDQTVYVGTMSGIYELEQNHFRSMSELERACWMLLDLGQGNYVAATSAGLFTFDDFGYRCLSANNTLSVTSLSNGDFLTGELDGIHLITASGSNRIVDLIPRVTSFSHEDDGTIKAYTLYGECYQLRPGSINFQKVEQQGQRHIFSYTDDEGLTWLPNDNGLGLRVLDTDGNEIPEYRQWLEALSQYSITALAFDGETVWLGTQDGLIRFNKDFMRTHQPLPTAVYIREFVQDDCDVSVVFSARKLDPIGDIRYSYRLNENQNWSPWDKDQTVSFFNLSYGHYKLQVRAHDIYGKIYYSEVYPFYVPYPFYLRWYSFLAYLIIIVIIARTIGYYRERKLRLEQIRLEQIVKERTQELRDAQKQLLRQEREATVGKLTKGLIDRILNPLNYINNFSHLSIGLAKDLKDDIEDEEENMTEDNYEDAQDVLQMLDQNLSKIEQHGLSTTRILKAMEELLRDRSGQLVEIDFVQTCEQAIEVFSNYKTEEFAHNGIHIEWEKPTEPIHVMGMQTQLIQTITSMLNNAAYALNKRAEAVKALPQGAAAYSPLIRVSVEVDDHVHLHIWDNGIGMEEGILDKIFDPFFTTKPTAEAPGVGLYLSQDIIQNHNGSIRARSVKDEFTEFIITLPIIDPTPTSPREGA